MFDHVSLTVSDLDRSVRFYTAALAPLGYELGPRDASSAGFGPPGKPSLWLQTGTPTARAHLAFASPTRAAVRAFHEGAVTSGGGDNGPPGLREAYAPTYYAAFAHDPDGNNVEAVCHAAR